MLKMVAGAWDHFTNIDEKEIAIIEIISGTVIDLFIFSPVFLKMSFLILLHKEGVVQSLLFTSSFALWKNLNNRKNRNSV